MTSGEPTPFQPPRDDFGAGARAPGGATPPNRRRRPLLPVAVALWALLEIWLLILLADAAGGPAVFLVVAAGFVLGSLAVKRAGRRAWRALSQTLQGPAEADAAPPAARGGNGLAMLGGLLLMLPGLLTDLIGLCCLFPPTARLLRSAAGVWAARGNFTPGSLGHAVQEARTAGDQLRAHRPDGKVVQGEVIRDEDGRGRP